MNRYLQSVIKIDDDVEINPVLINKIETLLNWANNEGLKGYKVKGLSVVKDKKNGTADFVCELVKQKRWFSWLIFWK